MSQMSMLIATPRDQSIRFQTSVQFQKSQGVQRHSSDQHDFDNSASESSETPVSNHWTASEFCQGFQNHNSESESAEWCSQGSGDKSSTAPLDEDVTAKLDPHPAMGIIIAPAQSKIQLVIAWLDKSDIWNDLPSVHAVCIATLNHPSGVFDLQNLFDSLSFILILFRLCSYFHELQSTYDAKFIAYQHGFHEVNALEWQSDHAPNAIPACRLFVNIFDKVSLWLKVVNHARQPELKLDSSNSLSPERLQSIVNRHLGPDLRDSHSEEGPFIITRHKKKNNNLKAGAASQPATTSEGASSWQIKKHCYVKEQTSTEAGLLPIALGERLLMVPLEGVPGDSDDDLSKSNVRSKRYLASSFATAHHRTGETTDGCIYSWMYWRGIKLDIYPSDICKQNQVTQMYKWYTDLYQSPTLFTRAQSSIPAVQAKLDVLKMNLDSGWMRFQSSDILPDPIGIYLKQKMELILTASQKA
ncbi:uncharacterized protein EV420DRAFT_1481899 [Desarmillaria tabescens]|uniref:Uncharacterized protein n=1 Tax=Armillaria tabescens TaxID=1929756 RepID=A0AA39K1J6_ARMTA|nr:uncharacterized protein EV420DRAFT_1481899 [Desarmillaria tabescens]KAK0452902.1 hypothetical protein EV420DRAFT_1481899 [Desarmillaria tabescens]